VHAPASPRVEGIDSICRDGSGSSMEARIRPAVRFPGGKERDDLGSVFIQIERR
jgi:hypothetical protein